MATLTLDQQRAVAIADAKRKQAQAGQQQEPYSGQILPFSKDAQGNVSFDSNAGVVGLAKGMVGAVKDAVTFPADAMRGKVDPLSDEGIARAVGMGAVVTPVSPAARAGIGWMGAPKTSQRAIPKTPTAVELKAAGGSGFDMARTMDVRYTPQSVQNMAMKLQSQLFRDGFRARAGSAPQTFAEISGILRSNEPGSFVSIDDLHAIRRSLQNTAQDFNNPTDQKAATQVIRAIDEFVTNPAKEAVLAGPAAAAGKVWGDAKGNYAAGKRSERIKGVEDNAELRAAVANSGLNLDNTIRQRVAAILQNDRLSAGYSPEELAMMRQVAEGTAARNTVRYVGNILGGGGGIGASMVGGMAGYAGGILGPMGGAALGIGVPAMGLALKKTGGALTKRALRGADEAIRQRSPLYKNRVETAPPKPSNPGVRAIAPKAAAGASMPQMTPEQWNEYLKQKYALQQGA